MFNNLEIRRPIRYTRYGSHNILRKPTKYNLGDSNTLGDIGDLGFSFKSIFKTIQKIAFPVESLIVKQIEKKTGKEIKPMQVLFPVESMLISKAKEKGIKPLQVLFPVESLIKKKTGGKPLKALFPLESLLIGMKKKKAIAKSEEEAKKAQAEYDAAQAAYYAQQDTTAPQGADADVERMLEGLTPEERLRALYEAGLITADEFQTQMQSLQGNQASGYGSSGGGAGGGYWPDEAQATEAEGGVVQAGILGSVPNILLYGALGFVAYKMFFDKKSIKVKKRVKSKNRK